MRKYVSLVILLFISLPGFALHIAGGELYYQYAGPGSSPNTDKYIVTLRLFRECNPVVPAGQSAAAMPDRVELGVFINTASGGTLMNSIEVSRTGFDQITLNSPLVCIVNPPKVCYQIGYFSQTLELPKQEYGYTIAYQTCCRSFSILNVTFFPIPNQAPGEGATYTCSIPGTNILGNEHNSSAVFAIKDTVLVCQFKKIKVDFSATDPDSRDTSYRDSLSYSFCSAFDKGAATSSALVTPSAPPYRNVTYNNGYSGASPLGPNIVIDPKTGIITGTSGTAGGYVVNVCVSEWRHGKIISVHRKDFLLRVTSCDFAAADLQPSYINCTDLTFNFQNESTSSSIHSYFWSFGDPKNPLGDTSNKATPSYTYPDTGQYTIKLVINKDEECTDSTTATVKAYPGFKANMSILGSCLQRPYDFIDQTVSKYGLVNSWVWRFGDGSSDSTQNARHMYNAVGTVNVSFTASDSKGCTETITKELKILNKPEITMPFRDTLICYLDTLQVFASANITGNYTWTGKNIINPGISNPFVYPRDTTTYVVSFDDGGGCYNTDSVKVNVVDSAIVHLGADTVICLRDTVQLITKTNALKFAWQPPPQLSPDNVQNPFIRPLTTTSYVVTATIGKHCLAKDTIVIAEMPYPEANAGPDVTLCYGGTTRLNGTIKGSSFTWSPAVSLNGANTLTPLAGPMATTTYTLIVYDTINKPNCPKPAYSYITVTIPLPVVAAVVSDTNAVIGQPLQLIATGGNTYLWQPPYALNNPGIYNPVATYQPGSPDSVTYLVTVRDANNCVGYTNATVHIYKTLPEIFVPTAFSPNGDGTNDILKVVTAGVKQFDYLHIFNRWGNMVFTTVNPSRGWDGTFNGVKQPAGTYVFDAQGIDYIGRAIRRKGTIVLIR